MSYYTNNIGSLGPWEGVGGGGTTSSNSSGIIASVLGIVGTVLGAVLPKSQTPTNPMNPYPYPYQPPTQAAQPAGISTSTILFIAAIIVVLKK